MDCMIWYQSDPTHGTWDEFTKWTHCKDNSEEVREQRERLEQNPVGAFELKPDVVEIGTMLITEVVRKRRFYNSSEFLQEHGHSMESMNLKNNAKLKKNHTGKPEDVYMLKPHRRELHERFITGVFRRRGTSMRLLSEEQCGNIFMSESKAANEKKPVGPRHDHRFLTLGELKAVVAKLDNKVAKKEARETAAGGEEVAHGFIEGEEEEDEGNFEEDECVDSDGSDSPGVLNMKAAIDSDEDVVKKARVAAKPKATAKVARDPASDSKYSLPVAASPTRRRVRGKASDILKSGFEGPRGRFRRGRRIHVCKDGRFW